MRFLLNLSHYNNKTMIPNLTKSSCCIQAHNFSMIRIFLWESPLHIFFVCVLIWKAPLYTYLDSMFLFVYCFFCVYHFPNEIRKKSFFLFGKYTAYWIYRRSAEWPIYINVNSMFMCLKMLKILYQPVCTQRCTKYIPCSNIG